MADQTPPPARQMSLIPYAHDSHREIVLYVSFSRAGRGTLLIRDTGAAAVQ